MTDEGSPRRRFRPLPWPDAIVFIAVVCVLAWTVVAVLFVGFDPGDPEFMAEEPSEEWDAAPASGPEESGPEGTGAADQPQ